jgi:hypothetical protein
MGAILTGTTEESIDKVRHSLEERASRAKNLLS